MLAVVLGCSKDPVSDRVAQLEDRVADLEQQAAITHKQLLARLDAIPVTAENQHEIPDVRAKMSQAGVTATEFRALQTRVDALERQFSNWSQVVAGVQRGVYGMLHGVVLPNDVEITFVGTAFAVTTTNLITNGHIVDALASLDAQVVSFNARYGAELSSVWFVAQNLTTVATLSTNLFPVTNYQAHEQWNAADLSSPDVAVLWIGEGTLPVRLTLATAAAARLLRVGDPVCTLGFPGELRGGY